MHTETKPAEALAILREGQDVESLCAEELCELLYAALCQVCQGSDVAAFDSLREPFRRLVQISTKESRLQMLRALTDLVEARVIHSGAIVPFTLYDTDPQVVAMATVEFASATETSASDPLEGVRAILNSGLAEAALPGAIFGALVSLGDRRLHELLFEAEWRLTTTDLKLARDCFSGFPSFAAIEFWLTSMEKWSVGSKMAEDAEDRDYADARLGLCGAGLAAIVTDAISPLVYDVERGFGFCHFDPPVEPVRVIAELPMSEIGEVYGDRFRALEQFEPAPKIMSRIMPLYGVEPQCPESEWAPIDLVAMAAARDVEEGLDDSEPPADIRTGNAGVVRSAWRRFINRTFSRSDRPHRRSRLPGRRGG